MAALPPLSDGGSSCVAPGPCFVLGMVKSSLSDNNPNLTSLENAKRGKMMNLGGNGRESQAKATQRHQSVREDRSREGSAITAVISPHTRKTSPVLVPCNLNHHTRRGNRPRAGKEVPILAKARRVGAAQVPARTHNVRTPASSPVPNIRKVCQRASK